MRVFVYIKYGMFERLPDVSIGGVDVCSDAIFDISPCRGEVSRVRVRFENLVLLSLVHQYLMMLLQSWHPVFLCLATLMI